MPSYVLVLRNLSLSETRMALIFGVNEDSIETDKSRSLPQFNLHCTSCNCLASLSMVGQEIVSTSSWTFGRSFFTIEVAWSA